MNFRLQAPYRPAGDQPQAIKELIAGFGKGFDERLTLLGVTGSGKTFTMASVIEGLNLPILVLTHNKTLAAQLYREFKNFFPNNAVEYFVSYYNYYQPEAYVPTTDTYIEKDSSINDEIDRLRLRATSSLLARSDVVIIASVSCIFGLGSPEDYQNSRLTISGDQANIDVQEILKKLIFLQYTRNDTQLVRGTFSLRGEILDIFPAYSQEIIRIIFYGDEIEKISLIHPVTGEHLATLDRAVISAAKHFITSPEKLKRGISLIEKELAQRQQYFQEHNKLLEAERIKSRVHYDIEMLKQVGYCSGIENYSRHLSGRKEGETPACLLDYFPKDFLLIVDESHVTLPQIRGMYEGDRSRKQVLVDYGFRLPSALDNRPLNFTEFDFSCRRVLYVSATPSEWELDQSRQVVEQIIRPTGLLDPLVIVRPPENQITDLRQEIDKRIKRKERTLITTLTKKMAEDLSDFYGEAGLKVIYLHSEIKTIERVEIIRDLRHGIYDVLIGVNLLREGLDIPEVSLVAILDADKEGFLRNERSLIQTIGRAARHVNGRAILYAKTRTQSIKRAIIETERRRKLQQTYNETHGITPRSISKRIEDIIDRTKIEERALSEIKDQLRQSEKLPRQKKMDFLRQEMLKMAKDLEFEKAALIRDQIEILKYGIKKKTKNNQAKRVVLPLKPRI